MFISSLPRNVDASFRDLGSAKAPIRVGAMADLVRHSLGDAATRARAIPLIERRLRDDKVAEVRVAAAVALSDLKAEEALPSLLLAVEDAHPMARQMAINALGEIGDVRGEPRLRRALADARNEVRYQAIIAYVRVAKDEADIARALGGALADDDDAIQHIALRLAEERLDEEPARAPDAAFVERAAKRLTSSHPDVAAAAAILLGKLGDDRAHDVLAAIVSGAGIAGGMPGKEEEQAAVELAGMIGLVDQRDALARRAWGVKRYFRDTCAFAALVALAALGDGRAKKELALLGEGNGKHAAAARDALVKLKKKESAHSEAAEAESTEAEGAER